MAYPVSDLRLAAIGKEFDAVDEARFVGGQEERRAGDLVSMTDAAERNQGRHIVEQPLLLGRLGTCETDKSRCFRRTGAERVDADAAVLQIEDPAAGEIAQCRL